MLPPEAELPPKPKEPGPKSLPLDREVIIAQRLSLFRSLFRGREDVYAKRWVSKDGQRAGYKPVCDFTNERGWCTKFAYGTANCSKCQSRQDRPLTDEVIARHLNKNAGEEDILGIYPTLDDNSVYFLCADFDDKTCKRGYREDVLSYVTVCREWGIQPCIERSRSGKGAHIWIFFSKSFPAVKARKLGFAILRKNTFNRINGDKRICDQNDTVWNGECSYIPMVKWCDFITNVDYMIERAERIKDNAGAYKLHVDVNH